jgi:hypothetical protein
VNPEAPHFGVRLETDSVIGGNEMSDMATTTSSTWEDTMLLLQQDSRDCGVLLLLLAQVESERAPSPRKSVWCTGRGARSQRYNRFAWHYWTRCAKRD